jgi:hypothetical protein
VKSRHDASCYTRRVVELDLDTRREEQSLSQSVHRTCYNDQLNDDDVQSLPSLYAEELVYFGQSAQA